MEKKFIRTYGRLRCRSLNKTIMVNNPYIFKEFNKNILETHTLEIGFGNGEVLIHRTMKHNHKNHIGVDVYENGIVKVLKAIENNQIKNLNIFQMDIRSLILEIKNFNKNNESKIKFQEIYILFPDPWHKKSEKKKEKKRLVNKDFLNNIKELLEINGKLFFASDHLDYFENVINFLKELNFNIVKTTVNEYINEDFILSNYEKKAINNRHYLMAIK